MSKSERKVHPMVAVPEAIITVIRETARMLIEQESNGRSETMSTRAPWKELLHRVVDQDILMNEPGYPPYRASIMDGYAIQTEKFDKQRQQAEWTHQVLDNVYAGDELAPSQTTSSSTTLPTAYYITTGAVVPDTYDRIVPIEEVKVSDDKTHIAVLPLESKNKWIRPVGCDIAAGAVVLRRGHTLDPVALGLLKQSGVETFEVKKPVRVGVLSTGNELLLGSSMSTEVHQSGKIPDANRPILLSLLATFGNCEPVDLGMERDDDVQAMAKTIEAALTTCDIILTTGGISMGETDIVERVLVDHCGGTLHFGRMHMKPGKPTTFVTIPTKDGAKRLVFAMPGNPVSAMVCTQLLVKPCLDLFFQGCDPLTSTESVEMQLDRMVDHALIHPEILATLTHNVELDAVRPEYHRVTIDQLPNGSYEATTTGVQRSSRLMSLRDAQGLLVLPEILNGKTAALKGETYPVLVLGGGGNLPPTRIQESVHLKKKKVGRTFRVGIVEVMTKGMESKLDSICDRAQSALGGSKSGMVMIVSKKSFVGSPDELYSLAIDSDKADFIVVSCSLFDGSFPYYLDVSSSLRHRLTKIADALALQARQGAAGQDPTAALFETVVGYASEQQGAMLVCLPEQGLDGALGNIRGLLKHALNVSRDKAHNDHHTHQHRDHAK
jgi:molybdopterin molybdotransferase